MSLNVWGLNSAANEEQYSETRYYKRFIYICTSSYISLVIVQVKYTVFTLLKSMVHTYILSKAQNC